MSRDTDSDKTWESKSQASTTSYPWGESGEMGTEIPEDLGDLDYDQLEKIRNQRQEDSEIEPNVQSSILNLTQDEPQTIAEIVNTVGSEHDLSRDQIEYRMQKLSDANLVNQKKGPGRTSPKIFWRD